MKKMDVFFFYPYRVASLLWTQQNKNSQQKRLLIFKQTPADFHYDTQYLVASKYSFSFGESMDIWGLLRPVSRCKGHDSILYSVWNGLNGIKHLQKSSTALDIKCRRNLYKLMLHDSVTEDNNNTRWYSQYLKLKSHFGDHTKTTITAITTNNLF